MAARRNIVLAIALLTLGIAGGAMAGISTGSGTAASTEVDVSLLEGKLRFSPVTLSPGKITLVVVNNGKATHGLAIMGTGLAQKHTPTLAAGKTARLTVTLKPGSYHLWDSVRGSMSHGKLLTVKAVESSSSGTAGGASGGTVTTPSSGGGVIDPTYDDGHGM